MQKNGMLHLEDAIMLHEPARSEPAPCSLWSFARAGFTSCACVNQQCAPSWLPAKIHRREGARGSRKLRAHHVPGRAAWCETVPQNKQSNKLQRARGLRLASSCVVSIVDFKRIEAKGERVDSKEGEGKYSRPGDLFRQAIGRLSST